LGTQDHSFKEVAENLPGVKSVSMSTTVPGRNNNNNGYMIEGRDDETFLIYTNWADYDFLETYEMEMAEGRFFDEKRGTDPQACIINEAAVKAFNLDDPLNQRIIIPGGGANNNGYAPIIGVVKDFHHESLHNQVEPYIIRYRSDNFRFGFITFRVEEENLQTTIDGIEKTWKEFTGNNPLQYFFADEEFDRLHREEKQNAQLSVVFSLLAILIGTLGLFGMTSYSLAQRTREIGVRRTMGASVLDIYFMISKEIAILIGIATAISWTVVFFFTKNWLENFHYRIGLNPLYFIYGLIIALVIAILTITFRTLKAARMNPAISLKYE
jgi:putative ABC transport system permease protein